jgi:uncharacterized protein
MITNLILATAVVAAIQAAPAPELVGRWEGPLTVGGQSIRIVFRVEADGKAFADSPDQGANGIPAQASLTGGVVRFTVPAFGGAFEGRLSDDGRTLTGALSQGGMTLPLVLTKSEAAAAPAPAADTAAAPNRPQNPQPPYPYREEEVAYDAGAGVRLAGTLTLPQGEGPFPAALLITGSGQQDRDETVFGHKPFWVLADALTRRGIAVLRVDDRGAGQSTGSMDDVTTADFAKDAEASFAWLAARGDIDADRIGLIGHSEGGTIAPMVAQADPRVAWIVMMAGPAVSGGDVLTEQLRRTQQASGLPAEIVEANTAVQARIMRAVAEHYDDGEAAARAARAIMAETTVPAAAADQAAAQAALPWTRWFVAHDPAESLSAFQAPMLAIYGGKDVQVPAQQSSGALRRLAPDADIVVLPDLNHLMQTAGTGLPAEYAQIEETIAPVALETIVDWVAARSR